ncbi:Glutathione transport system permease protein gsiC [uncultured Clostridium sp.]|uniref:ABC transporter permease n=1 Tax=uncultured Clostridium sp. TaxID=59620 RepID=UPI000823412A|nr:ABC transporter permease [uncultured Clostridium sp.]SCJ58982.1 Glutathione transport system permease protein gsiC [uncultured Clostridium sp.]
MNHMVKKIITGFLCLFLIVTINFFLPRLLPGDPVLMLTGMDEDAISEAKYKSYKERLGVDRPIGEQFVDYIKDIIKGDLGYSYYFNDDVSNIILRRIPNTLQIAIPTVILSSIIALIWGSIAGYRENKLLDNISTTTAIIINAIPGFVLAMFMVTVFAFKLRIFPLGGLNSINIPEGILPAFLDRVRHLILPVITLTIASVPGKYILVRNTVAAAKKDKYVMYAKARGISEIRVIFAHILKNICGPFITIVGLQIGFIISGSMICETIFSIKGMGSLIYQATASRDYPTMQGCLFVTALAVVIATIITDILCISIDPRVRSGIYEEA